MNEQLTELLHQMLETELGGVKVYETALQCAVHKELKKEWTEYLKQTTSHVKIIRELFTKLGIAEEETPGRKVVRHIGESLVAAMMMAKKNATSEAAELVACECVVFAETKDHLNWELLSTFAAKQAKGTEGKALREACDDIEVEEDEHVYHTKG